MVRSANRLRQSQRPQDPIDLQFELTNEHLSADFVQTDMEIGERRHLIMATNGQLELLKKAKSWYVDGTFKLCRHPFEQLLTINAFVRKDDSTKQVPLVYVLMSGRKKRDYKKVFDSIINLIAPNNQSPTALRKIMVDYEKGLWSALRELLPEVIIVGCVFHWTQAVWRKVTAIDIEQLMLHMWGFSLYTYIYFKNVYYDLIYFFST